MISSLILAASATGMVGWMSDYIFRGFPLKNSSVMVSGDLEHNKFYLGAWAADVDPGLEIDLYGGYAAEHWTAGLTFYTFTDAFDENALELNLGASWEWVSVQADFAKTDDTRREWAHYAITIEKRGAYGTVGTWSKDLDGEYLRLGYQSTLGEGAWEIDWDLNYQYDVTDESSLVLILSKRF